jgi:DNA-binding response OmpR family regulator
VKRILLVDDSPLIRAAAQYALEQAGYAVATRATFDELVTQPLDDFALILMDVQMPELYGDDVAAVLRHERGVGTPIYLFSSLDAAELAQRVAEGRLDGFISKQTDMSGMVQRVREILGDR